MKINNYKKNQNINSNSAPNYFSDKKSKQNRDSERKPYSDKLERKTFKSRPDRISFSGNSERKPFEQRPDRNLFSGNNERRPFEQRPDRNSFSGNNEGRPFEQRPHRNSFSGNSERRPFAQRPHRNSFSGNNERRPFDSRSDRSSFLKSSEEKSFRYGDGKSFSPKRESSFSSASDNRRQSFERTNHQYSQKKHYTENKYNTKFSSSQENGAGNDSMRLNVYISKSGLCSRRSADDIIMKGEITVNGEIVKDLGVKVKKGDTVRHNSKILYPQEKVYILLNKPKGYTTTVSDPHEKKTVMDLVKGACRERIYPIGRLDKDTIGVLLLTNDGDLAKSLSHPSSMIPKVYRVVLDKPIEREDLKKIREGLMLEDGVANVDDIQVDKEDPRICGVEIHIGRNRIVRRIFESLGYEVLLLERNLYAGLTRTRVSRGEWRFLTSLEVANLKRITNKIDL